MKIMHNVWDFELNWVLELTRSFNTIYSIFFSDVIYHGWFHHFLKVSPWSLLDTSKMVLISWDINSVCAYWILWITTFNYMMIRHIMDRYQHEQLLPCDNARVLISWQCVHEYFCYAIQVERKPLVCVLGVPNHMTYADFCQFCGSFVQHILEMRIVRSESKCNVNLTKSVYWWIFVWPGYFFLAY